MAPDHQEDFSNAQWDEEVVAKVKIGVQGMFQDWLKTLDEVALEVADEKDLWTQWVKSNFWLAAQSILKEDNAVAAAAAAAAGGSDPCMTPRPIRARSGPLEETPSKPQRRKVEGRFTVLSELGQQVKPLYSVYGRVLMASQVESLSWKGNPLPKCSYVLATPEASVEVIAFGNDAAQVQKAIWPLRGCVVELERVQWNSTHRKLKHVEGTSVRASINNDAAMEQANVVAVPFEHVVSAPAWSRVSVRGILHSCEESRQSERKPDNMYVDIVVQNEKFQGMHARVWYPVGLQLPALSVGDEIVVRNATVALTVLNV